MPQIWRQRRDLLQVAFQVWRHGGFGSQAVEGSRSVLAERTPKLFVTTCFRACGHQSARLPLPIDATTRCKAAKAAEEPGVGRPALRLPAPAHSAKTRRCLDELEEAGSPLPRGTAPRSQTRWPQAGPGHASTDEQGQLIDADETANTSAVFWLQVKKKLGDLAVRCLHLSKQLLAFVFP